MGYVFTTTSDLINTIENTLQTAGWQTVEKAGDGLTLFMKGITSQNSHECFMEFKVSANGSVTNGFWLDHRGFLDAARSAGSPAATLRHSYVVGQPNRLWLTADNDSGCISVLDATNTMRGSHFGFLNRVDITDQWAWMVGWIHSLGYQYVYTAKSKFNNTNWRLLSDDYNSYTTRTSSTYPAIPTSTFDFMQRGFGRHNYYAYGTTDSPFYNGHYGRLNYTGRPVIDPYCYQEGRGSTTAYGGYQLLYFRGYVKHAYCGVASLPQAAQVVDTTGYRILSVGAAGGWQGMRIA
jgi:hypothetical protein